MSFQLIPLSRKKSKSASTFLKKTFDMLCEPQNFQSIKWAKDGIGFIVVEEDKFSKEVLPKYFKHSNYSSFVRQLNMYNFHKIREGNSESYFHHELFDKNRKELLGEIRRKPEKKKRKSVCGSESDYEELSVFRVKESEKENKIQYIPSLKQINQSQNEKHEKKPFQNTRHIFGSEQDHDHNSVEERSSIKNITANGQNDDDKISINNELVENVPRSQNKEILYPSNHNLYPYSYGVKINQVPFY